MRYLTGVIAGAGAQGFLEAHRALIADIAVAAVFLAFALHGAKRGLYKTVSGVIVFVLAVISAIAVSGFLTPIAVDRFWPQVEEKISVQFEESGYVLSEFAENISSDLEGMLKLTGMEDEFRAFTEEQVAVGWTEGLIMPIKDMLKGSFEQIAHGVLFVLCFFAGILVFKLIAKAVGPVSDLPVIRTVDWLGGFGVGFLECLIIFYIVTKICAFRNVSFFSDMAEGTELLSRILGL